MAGHFSGFMFRSIILATVGFIAFQVPVSPVAGQEAPLPVDVAKRWASDGQGGTPSLTKHVVPLFNRVGCSNRTCHGSFQGQNGFRLSLFGYDPGLDYQELTADEGHGPRVNVQNVAASLALLKPTREVPHKGGELLDKNGWQYRLFQAWIAGGAPYQRGKEPSLTSLRAFPAELR